jgi:hypothetical protein
MTAVQMLQEVTDKTNGTGKGKVSMDGMWVNVKVIDARKVFGRVDVLVTPISGEGQSWIQLDRLQGGLAVEKLAKGEER